MISFHNQPFTFEANYEFYSMRFAYVPTKSNVRSRYHATCNLWTSLTLPCRRTKAQVQGRSSSVIHLMQQTVTRSSLTKGHVFVTSISCIKWLKQMPLYMHCYAPVKHPLPLRQLWIICKANLNIYSCQIVFCIYLYKNNKTYLPKRY